MTRSELIDLMADGQSQLSAKDVELAVKLLIDHMAEDALVWSSVLRSGVLAVFLCTIENLGRAATPAPETQCR